MSILEEAGNDSGRQVPKGNGGRQDCQGAGPREGLEAQDKADCQKSGQHQDEDVVYLNPLTYTTSILRYISLKMEDLPAAQLVKAGVAFDIHGFTIMPYFGLIMIVIIVCDESSRQGCCQF